MDFTIFIVNPVKAAAVIISHIVNFTNRLIMNNICYESDDNEYSHSPNNVQYHLENVIM